MKKTLLLFFMACGFFQLQAARIDTITLNSTFLRKSTRFVVVIPDKSNEGMHFPVVYLLHGYSGNYAQWLHDAPQLAMRADEYQIMLVTPDGGYGSWYFDSPLDSLIRYESFITRELISYIDMHYPTLTIRTARAITGLSMGGHGALFLATRHSDVLGAAGSICGGVDFRPFPENWDIKKALGAYAENTDLWDAHVVMNVIDRLQNKDLALIIDCGLSDFFLEVNRALHHKLMERKIDHDYIERPGTHNAAYWRNSIDYQLLYFSRYFKDNMNVQSR